MPKKSKIASRSNRHLTQSRLQVTGCTAERYCLLHVVAQGPGSFRGQVNFFVRRTVAELRGFKVAQFSDFCLFSPHKTPKKIFRWPAYSPGVTSQNDSDFPYGSRRSKRVPSGSEGFLWLLIGELGTPKLAQIVTYGKWLYPYKMLLHGASRQIWTKDVWKCAILRTYVLSRQIYPPLPAKSPQNQIFGIF